MLHQFTIGPDATRVAIVTYSTAATVDIDHVSTEGVAADHVTKCDVYRRIGEALENMEPEGHSATGEALHRVYELLIDSRPDAKKAVFLITDGRLKGKNVVFRAPATGTRSPGDCAPAVTMIGWHGTALG